MPAGCAPIWPWSATRSSGGRTFVLVKETIRGVSPLLFLAMRFSLATVALVIVYWSDLRAARKRRRRRSRAGMIAGCFLFCGYAFQTIGLRLTTAAKSAFITGLSIAAGTFGGRARL